jgi:formate hydrogenlyase subunit 3/multisubunit Na+/H+ antiporter MnhD subunit
VNPLIILAVLMGTAFLMPLFEKTGKFLPRLAFLSALGVLAAGSAIGLAGLALGGPVIEAATAGFSPPMSINLRAGLPEAALWTASAFILLIGGVYLIRRERDGMYDRMLFLIVALGVSGLILTRDLFNVFVFLEITSLGVYGLIGRGGDNSLQAGFKYMVAGGMASILFLIGTVFLYRLTGTLNLDDMAAAGAGGSLSGAAGASALAFLSLAFLIELKPFPANGWALDAYQAAPSGVGALLSSAQATAVFVAFAKVAPMMGERLLTVISVVGVLTFFFANLIGMKQKDEKRMLGYSSTGQVGLALFAWTVSRFAGIPESSVLLIVGGIPADAYVRQSRLVLARRHFGRLG